MLSSNNSVSECNVGPECNMGRIIDEGMRHGDKAVPASLQHHHHHHH